jgi:hypothetical protein
MREDQRCSWPFSGTSVLAIGRGNRAQHQGSSYEGKVLLKLSTKKVFELLNTSKIKYTCRK